MRSRLLVGLLLVAPLVVSALVGCSGGTQNTPDPVQVTAAAGDLPDGAAALGELMLSTVPGGLHRVRDDELDPPAGRKTVQDVAGYSHDPERDVGVLEGYGYRWGWERFWRDDDRQATIFVDQFAGPPGAAAYAGDLARNDAEYYGGALVGQPADLPGGCALMQVDDPADHTGLAGPSAFAWCAHGPFTVSVAVLDEDVASAEDAVREVVLAQLDRLPGS